LELDAAAAAPLESLLEHEQLRLDVRARAPRGRREPRPADLDAPVLGALAQEARAADRNAGLPQDGRERLVVGRERLVDPRLQLLRGSRLEDREPAPDGGVAGRRPEAGR